MIRIFENDFENDDESYEHNGHIIRNNTKTGLWDVDNLKDGFSTDVDAEYTIDNPNTETKIISDDELKATEEMYELPVGSTTYDKIKIPEGKEDSKYSHCFCRIYVLKYINKLGILTGLYAGKGGLCEYLDDNMEIFKTKEIAENAGKNKIGNYKAIEKTLSHGEILNRKW